MQRNKDDIFILGHCYLVKLWFRYIDFFVGVNWPVSLSLLLNYCICKSPILFRRVLCFVWSTERDLPHLGIVRQIPFRIQEKHRLGGVVAQQMFNRFLRHFTKKFTLGHLPVPSYRVEMLSKWSDLVISLSSSGLINKLCTII